MTSDEMNPQVSTIPNTMSTTKQQSRHPCLTYTEWLEDLLGCFEEIRATGPDRWQFRCPAHPDTNPSGSLVNVGDKVLIKCWAGCSAREICEAMGRSLRDLFYRPYPNKHNHCSKNPNLRQSTFLFTKAWNWRETCAELELAIQVKRERHEAILTATYGLDINQLTPEQFDEVMTYVGQAYSWLDCCERLDDTLYLLQGTLRDEEQQAERKKQNRINQ